MVAIVRLVGNTDTGRDEVVVRFPQKLSIEESRRLEKALPELRRELAKRCRVIDIRFTRYRRNPITLVDVLDGLTLASVWIQITGGDKRIQSFIDKNVKRWKRKHAKPKGRSKKRQRSLSL